MITGVESIIGLVLIWSGLKSTVFAFIFGILFSGRPECLNCLWQDSFFALLLQSWKSLRELADWALYTYKSWGWQKRYLSRVRKPILICYLLPKELMNVRGCIEVFQKQKLSHLMVARDQCDLELNRRVLSA